MGEFLEKTVLVVEDERPLLDAISQKLESKKIKVVTARSSEEALEYIAKNTAIDAIWLDHYLLGKLDGLDFVAKLKSKSSKYRSVPIFVVSNTASSDKVNTYLKLGIDKYYTKAEYRLDQIISDLISHLKS
ncbi:hypothetical protein A2873_03780 [Candidatus Woesebacteria bacterium RIFCSPHIGHO2_01_FULL_42_80]|nr:MAG: hypothetical protein A2873_03780 [Candidatus Woesebacteria bacterium RIFCSPHIGHO2_01_FULL_42_80]OGM66587.1 MAG: hypothetical protein A2969_01340 [Candidatus Woesebacteria bacterium RIFCSPLOWO2_01_FULL_42_67]OGM70980.1 MAG: hypothetical protein A3I55_04620 [Candidatus Woesebacteria bacterium RIFCSPLOWO2_02_FULL_42_10]OGM73902.1 MAG: hypothetical protein A3H21_04760 [Candidatus Woesebacteria bacterium RIFCSPLOWO2_12_FULL_42_8]